MHTDDLYERLASASRRGLPDVPAPADFLADASEIALYGAGKVGRDVLRLLTAKGWSVRCFLDQNARPGDRVDGLPVYKPGDPAFGEETRRGTSVIVSVFNPYVDMPALLTHLRQLGWTRVMHFVQFHRGFSAELGDRFWLTDLQSYAGHAARMRAGTNLWSDARSRELYDAVLRYRLEADPTVLPPPDAECQYLPGDLPAWQTPSRFVDCGAFDGDTIQHMQATGFPLEAVAAFEPDAVNLRRLIPRLATLAAGGLETSLWPCAVYSGTTQLRFDSGHGAASGLSAAGTDVVQAVALDEVLLGFRPTLIKMDIEGAEYEALLGARETIQRHRPGLAICLYHRAHHLWQIPLLVQSWNLGYRMHLRLHCQNAFELVLYAQADPA